MENLPNGVPIVGYEKLYLISKESDGFHVFNIRANRPVTITYRKSKVVDGVTTEKGYVNLALGTTRKDWAVEKLWLKSTQVPAKPKQGFTFRNFTKKPIEIEEEKPINSPPPKIIKFTKLKKGS